MDRAEVERRVEEALVSFRAADRYLLEHDLSERCIAARLALHLQRIFEEYTVDVEYNRAGDLAKRLNVPEECGNSFDEHGRALVVPDIIVHRRGPEGPNILGLELKKARDPRGLDCDRRRLAALRRHLGYEHGALLVCDCGRGEAAIRVREWVDPGP
jgi:hypothetical protein